MSDLAVDFNLTDTSWQNLYKGPILIPSWRYHGLQPLWRAALSTLPRSHSLWFLIQVHLKRSHRLSAGWRMWSQREVLMMFWLQTIQLTAHQSCGRLCWVVTGLQTPDSPRWECWGSGWPWHPGYHMLLRDLEAVIMERQREGASFQTHTGRQINGQRQMCKEPNTLVHTVIQMFRGTNTHSEEQTDTCKDNHMKQSLHWEDT